MIDTYTIFSRTTQSFLLGFLSCVIFCSCGPSKDERALEVFCRTEGPQLSNTWDDSDVDKKDCYFYGNSIYLYSILVNTDKDIINLYFDTPLDELTSQLKELFAVRGKELLLDMASSNKRFKIVLRQTQKVGYDLVIIVKYDEVITFDKSTISTWNIK